MRLADLLVAVHTLDLDTLEAIQVVINGRVSSLQEDGKAVAKSKRQATSVVDAFAKEGMAVTPKRVGRKPDPNSAFQRVKASVEKLVAQAGEEGIHISHLFPKVMKETGLSLVVCKTNAMQIKEVVRNYGHWKKAA